MDPEQEVNSDSECSDTNQQKLYAQTTAMEMDKELKRTWKCLYSLGILCSPFLLIVANLGVL